MAAVGVRGLQRSATMSAVSSSVLSALPVPEKSPKKVDAFAGGNMTNTGGPQGSDLGALIRATASAFVTADTNGDQMLDFDEFKTTVPKSTREQYSESTLRELFDAADHDRSGQITRDEYFFWSLSAAEQFAGGLGSMDKIFTKFDKSNDGQLNLLEFSTAVEVGGRFEMRCAAPSPTSSPPPSAAPTLAPHTQEFGYGQLGHDIFLELDSDCSGAVRYRHSSPHDAPLNLARPRSTSLSTSLDLAGQLQ